MIRAGETQCPVDATPWFDKGIEEMSKQLEEVKGKLKHAAMDIDMGQHEEAKRKLENVISEI